MDSLPVYGSGVPDAVLQAEERMKSIKDMTFEEWKAWKQEELKRKTHGAEAVPYDDPLYDAKAAVVRHCFDRASLYYMIPLYYTPPDLEETHSDAAGMYGYGIIMIKKQYYAQHGVDDAMINLLHHELCHAYCDMKIPEKKVHDTDGAFHRKEFAEVCEQHGGLCRYVNSVDGYSDSELTPESMELVRKDLRKA